MQYDSGGTDYPEGMVASPDGSTVFVTGYSVLPDYSTDFATIAYDARTGAQRWVAGYDDPSNSDDSPLAIAASPDGSSVFVTGLSTGATTSWDLTTISYDAVTGEQRWLATYSGPGSAIDVGSVLGVSPDGQTVFVTGRTDVGSIADAITVAYDAATGAQRWMDVWPGPEGTGYYALDQGISPDGSKVFVTGFTGEQYISSEYVTVGYDAAAGTRRWVAIYPGVVKGRNEPAALAVDPSGRSVVVTGVSSSANQGWNYATLDYDAATGRQRWLARYVGPGDSDQAHDVAASPNGNVVFVTGQSEGTGADDFATIAYSTATGAQRWLARYNGGPSSLDVASSIAVTSDGKTVYVTGSSTTSDTSRVWATVPYDAATGTSPGVIQAGPGDATAVAVNPIASEFFVLGWLGAGAPHDIRTMAYRS
jgi:WD40 repeat protein